MGDGVSERIRERSIACERELRVRMRVGVKARVKMRMGVRARVRVSE